MRQRKMNEIEFIRAAVQSGYANTAAAKAYTERTGKECYSAEDFIDLHQMSMHWQGVSADKGLRSVYGMAAGCRTTAISNGIQGDSGSGQDWK